MDFDIIIPCRTLEEARRCVVECGKLIGVTWHVYVLPDEPPRYMLTNKNVTIIPTGKVLPSHKRDIGIQAGNGDYCAFIDSDAYPPSQWLMASKIRLKNGYKGVCGPGILPVGVSWREEVADGIMKRLPHKYRVTPEPARTVDDYPTFNLILNRVCVEKAGGFGCDYLTGEDTLLCKKVVYDQNERILYDPECYVYHHRRPVWIPFLRQVATYGKHRGYFFKRYPETSRKAVYIFPLMGLLCIMSMLGLVAYWFVLYTRSLLLRVY